MRRVKGKRTSGFEPQFSRTWEGLNLKKVVLSENSDSSYH
jgi:hypothetical protein